MKTRFLAIFFIIFLGSFARVQGADPYSIVFIHIGRTIPSHVPVALLQARAFNTGVQLFLSQTKRLWTI